VEEEESVEGLNERFAKMVEGGSVLNGEAGRRDNFDASDRSEARSEEGYDEPLVDTESKLAERRFVE